jgi:hypothetical protein
MSHAGETAQCHIVFEMGRAYNIPDDLCSVGAGPNPGQMGDKVAWSG